MLAAKALPGAPYDGHSLATVIPHLQALIDNEIKRVIADKGYRGNGLSAPHDMRSTSRSRSAASPKRSNAS